MNNKQMVYGEFGERPIWSPFRLFNKNDSGFTEIMNNNIKLLTSWKYLEDSGLCLIGYLRHNWLGAGFLTIFASKFQ